MQLSPLQSRLAASVLATCLLVSLYFTLFSSRFALAAELEHDVPVIFDDDDTELWPDLDLRSSLNPTYEPEFGPFDRSIIGRAAAPWGLTNNVPNQINVPAGSLQYFSFDLSSVSTRETSDDLGAHGLELRQERNESEDQVAGLEEKEPNAVEREGDELRKRQTSTTVYISANTCLQPQITNGSQTTSPPPQLTLYVSTSSSNTNPGPGQSNTTQVEQEFKEGAVMYNVTASSFVYVGVYAPNVSTSLYSSTTYNVEVAMSTDAWYHSYNADSDADLIWVDSDSKAALLMTHNLTQDHSWAVDQTIMSSLPYVMFAQNMNDSSISGMSYSYCGLKNYAQIAATKNGKDASMVTTGMTTWGQGNLPKQQFYFSGLNSSSKYIGILAQDGNSTITSLSKRESSTIGGGGHVFKSMNFSTKSVQSSCTIITNLSFCNQVAYAVPSNPQKFPNASALAAWYDNTTQAQYKYFQLVLAQIPCEAPPEQRYSLARNCNDCANAYKDWVCSVMIPRCEDFSNAAGYLQPRDIYNTFPDSSTLDSSATKLYPNTSAYNSSRNPLIDQWVSPGPYKEVLPCADLCYNLVQSCPASMGFGCPTVGDVGFNTSYGLRTSTDQDADPTCNYPGSAHFFSAADRTSPGMAVLLAVLAGITSYAL